MIVDWMHNKWPLIIMIGIMSIGYVVIGTGIFYNKDVPLPPTQKPIEMIPSTKVENQGSYMIGEMIIHSFTINAMTNETTNNVKIGYYKSYDGVKFTPMLNYTDSNGLHIVFENDQKGIFYVVPLLDNNTDEFIAPVNTLYANKAMNQFDFISIHDGIKQWAFKTDGNRLGERCNAEQCSLTDNAIVKINVFKSGIPETPRSKILVKNIGTTPEGNIQCVGCDLEHVNKHADPTILTIPIRIHDCTVIPISSVAITLKASPMMLNAINSWFALDYYKFSFYDSEMNMIDGNIDFNYTFYAPEAKSFGLAGAKNNDLKGSYYMTSQCEKNMKIPEIKTGLALSLYKNYTVTGDERISYILPNGTKHTESNPIKLCESECVG